MLLQIFHTTVSINDCVVFHNNARMLIINLQLSIFIFINLRNSEGYFLFCRYLHNKCVSQSIDVFVIWFSLPFTTTHTTTNLSRTINAASILLITSKSYFSARQLLDCFSSHLLVQLKHPCLCIVPSFLQYL